MSNTNIGAAYKVSMTINRSYLKEKPWRLLHWASQRLNDNDTGGWFTGPDLKAAGFNVMQAVALVDAVEKGPGWLDEEETPSGHRFRINGAGYVIATDPKYVEQWSKITTSLGRSLVAHADAAKLGAAEAEIAQLRTLIRELSGGTGAIVRDGCCVWCGAKAPDFDWFTPWDHHQYCPWTVAAYAGLVAPVDDRLDSPVPLDEPLDPAHHEHEPLLTRGAMPRLRCTRACCHSPR